MKTFIYFSQGEWRTFQAEELPVKPIEPPQYIDFTHPEEGLRQFEFGGDIFGYERKMRKYESEIAALKAKGVKVGNPEMFTNSQGYWLDVNVGNGKPKEDEIYRWPGTVEIKEELEYPIDHTSYPPYIEVAILKLPQ